MKTVVIEFVFKCHCRLKSGTLINKASSISDLFFAISGIFTNVVKSFPCWKILWNKNMTPKQSPGIFSTSSRYYLFRVNNENTEIMCKICSKLAIKTPERFFHILFWCSYRWIWASRCQLGKQTLIQS